MSFVHVFGVIVDIDFIFFLLSIMFAFVIFAKTIFGNFNYNNNTSKAKLPGTRTRGCVDHSLNQILLNPVYSHVPGNIFHHLTD